MFVNRCKLLKHGLDLKGAPPAVLDFKLPSLVLEPFNLKHILH